MYDKIHYKKKKKKYDQNPKKKKKIMWKCKEQYNYDWFEFYGRNQHNTVKQFSSN